MYLSLNMLSLFQLFFLGYLSIPSIEVSCEDNDTNTSLPNINSKIIENVKNLLNPHYIGSECYEHSYFPPEKCDLKLYGFCSPYIPSCAMWKSGLFVHDPKKPAESAMTPRKCSSYWQGQFESGVWTSPDCPVTWFTPEELRYE